MATSKQLPSTKPKPKTKAKPKPKPKATSASHGMFGVHPDASMNPVGYHPSDPALTAPQPPPSGLTAPQGATSVPGQVAPPNPMVPQAHPDAALLDIIHAAIASHRAAVK